MDAGCADCENRDLEALGERVDGHGRVGQGRSEQRQQLPALNEGLRNLGRLGLIGGVIVNRQRELGAVNPSLVVDGVDGQHHAVLRAWPVDAPCACQREDGAELDGLALVGTRAAGAARGVGRPARGEAGGKDHRKHPNDRPLHRIRPPQYRKYADSLPRTKHASRMLGIC